MDFTRRGFLKLFGIAGAATLIDPGKAVVSLFGSPDQMASGPLMGFHVVVPQRGLTLPGWSPVAGRWGGTSKALTATAYGVSTFPGDNSRIVMNGGMGMAFEESDEIVVPIPRTDNPHIGFYRASEEARHLFARRAKGMLMRVPEHYRARTKLVTVVHQPIYARPGGIWTDKPWSEEDGLEVVCDCTTRVLWDDTDFSGWQVLSNYGEVPIETPSEISLKILLDVDRKIIAQSGKEWDEYQKVRSRRGFFGSLIKNLGD